jgi:single-strand DNA-binding protein
MNKWSGTGRLTRDAELKFTAGKGTAVANFTMAVNTGFGDKKETAFIPIVVWGKGAESVATYTQKGSKVLVSGRIATRSYDNSNGQKVYVTEVIADMYGGVEFLDNKNKESGNSQGSFGGSGFNEDIIPVDDGDMPF